LGFRVVGLGLRVSGVGCRVSGFGCRVEGVGFGVWGFGFRVSGFGFRVSGFGFRVSGLEFTQRPPAGRIRGGSEGRRRVGGISSCTLSAPDVWPKRSATVPTPASPVLLRLYGWCPTKSGWSRSRTRTLGGVAGGEGACDDI